MTLKLSAATYTNNGNIAHNYYTKEAHVTEQRHSINEKCCLRTGKATAASVSRATKNFRRENEYSRIHMLVEILNKTQH